MTSVSAPPARGTCGGWWATLLPLTYLLHIAEEYSAGESFFVWTSRLGWPLSEQRFLVLNGIALAVMTGAVMASTRWRHARIAIPAFGFAVMLNGMAHAVASVVTSSYSPGLVTGLVVWVPLGTFTLRRCWTSMPRRRFAGGIALGAGAHLLVTVLAFSDGGMRAP